MGLATGKYLLKQGWKLTIVDMNVEVGEKLASELGALFVKADVTVYEDLANAFARSWKEYGRLDFGMYFENRSTQVIHLTIFSVCKRRYPRQVQLLCETARE